MKADTLKFVFFCIGISVAMASSLIFLLILSLNLNGVEILTFEHNPLIATLEISMLVIAAATCAVATEIYYSYLKMKARGS